MKYHLNVFDTGDARDQLIAFLDAQVGGVHASPAFKYTVIGIAQVGPSTQPTFLVIYETL